MSFDLFGSLFQVTGCRIVTLVKYCLSSGFVVARLFKQDSVEEDYSYFDPFAVYSYETVDSAQE